MTELYYNSKENIYIEVSNDCEPINPREYGDYESKFITWSRNYHSPDKNPFCEWKDMMKYFGAKYTGHMRNDLDSLMSAALKKGYVLLPVWKYEHGNIAYQAAPHYPFLSDGFVATTPGYEGGWDGGLSGVIYTKRNRRNIEKVMDQLHQEVEEYTAYVNAECYRLSIYDKEGYMCDSISNLYGESTDKSLVEELDGKYLGYGIKAEDLEAIESDYYIDVEAKIAMHQEQFKEKSNAVKKQKNNFER